MNCQHINVPDAIYYPLTPSHIHTPSQHTQAPNAIKALVSTDKDPKAMLDGKVSENNWKMINNALTGRLIVGAEMKSSFGGQSSMLYTASI
jgi:hypothetical protein